VTKAPPPRVLAVEVAFLLQAPEIKGLADRQVHRQLAVDLAVTLSPKMNQAPATYHLSEVVSRKLSFALYKR
jgi:hypothetical protein